MDRDSLLEQINEFSETIPALKEAVMQELADRPVPFSLTDEGKEKHKRLMARADRVIQKLDGKQSAAEGGKLEKAR